MQQALIAFCISAVDLTRYQAPYRGSEWSQVLQAGVIDTDRYARNHIQ